MIGMEFTFHLIEKIGQNPRILLNDGLKHFVFG